MNESSREHSEASLASSLARLFAGITPLGFCCCEKVWPDIARFRHFGEIFKVLGNYSRVYFLLGTILNLLSQILCTFGRIFVDLNGQLLKNNPAIWSNYFGLRLILWKSESIKWIVQALIKQIVTVEHSMFRSDQLFTCFRLNIICLPNKFFD